MHWMLKAACASALCAFAASGAAWAQAMHADAEPPAASAVAASAASGANAPAPLLPLTPQGQPIPGEGAAPPAAAPRQAETSGLLWKRLDNAPLQNNPPQVMFFCSIRSSWCAAIKPQIAEWGLHDGRGVQLRLVPAVAGMDDLPLAKAQIAEQRVVGYAPAFELALGAASDRGLDSTDSKQVESWVKNRYPNMAAEFGKAFEDPATDVQAREQALILRGYGIKSLPTAVVNGRCMVRQEDVATPEEFLPRVKLALQNCR